MHTIYKKIITIYLLLAVLTLVECVGEAPIVPESELFAGGTFTGPGSTLMTVTMVSPINNDSNIPLDANIVLVFNSTVNSSVPAGNLTGNITITGSISGLHAFPDPGSTSATQTLNPAVNFNAGETITVVVNSAIVDTTPKTLDRNYTFTFVTGTATTGVVAPRVIAGTQTPTGAAVKSDSKYIELTFNKAVAGATVNAGTFTIAPACNIAGFTNIGGNTWRMTLNPNPTRTLAYNTAYTVALTAGINDGALPLVLDGQHTWNFTTEVDPSVAGTPQVDTSWAENITISSANVYFTTNESVDVATVNVRLLYGLTTQPILPAFPFAPPGPYSTTSAVEGNWDGGSTQQILNRISLAGLTASRALYYRIWIDYNGNNQVDATEISGEYNFMTRKVMSNEAGAQNGTIILQNPLGGGYIFWVSTQAGNSDIYGQYISTTGSPQWASIPGGTAVSSHANNQDTIVAISDGAGGAIVVYNDGGSLYSKRIYENAGAIAFTAAWGQTALTQGVSLGIGTIQQFSAALLPGGTMFVVGYVDSVGGFVKSRIFNVADGTIVTFRANPVDPAPANAEDDVCTSSGTYTGTTNGTYTVRVTSPGTLGYGGASQVEVLYAAEGVPLPGASLGFANPAETVDFFTDKGVSFSLADKVTNNNTLTNGDDWTIEVGNRVNIDTVNLGFTRVDVATSDGVNSDFFAVYSSASRIDAASMKVNFTPTGPPHTTFWTETDIFNTNGKAAFGWASTTVAKVLQSSVWTDTCYLLAYNTATDKIGLAMLDDGSLGLTWVPAAQFNGRDPDMVIDTIAGGANERSLIAYRDNGANYNIEVTGYNSAGTVLAGWPKNVTALAAYNCDKPKITIGNDDGNDSSMYVTWFDGRKGAGDYVVYSQQLDSTGAANWNAMIYDTAGGAVALCLLYYNDFSQGAYWGLIPMWQELTDLYYELVGDYGTY